MRDKKLELSSLNHTWILDLDGSILKHNGYKIDGFDTFLEGAKDFLKSIPEDDMIIFLTARNKNVKKTTEDFLIKNGIRYSQIIFDAPYGERVILNDNKISGLKMGIAFNKKRDSNNFPKIIINTEI